MKIIQHIKYIALLLFTICAYTTTYAADVNVDLAGVDVFHCPQGCDAQEREKNFSLVGVQGEPSVIEYEVVNKSDHPHKIKINFVDGGITKDASQAKACKNEGIEEQFGQHVSGYKDIVTLKPGDTLTQTATIDLPATSVGQALGCLTYSLVDDEEDSAGMFKILIRKARFVDMTIPGELSSEVSLFGPEVSEGRKDIDSSDIVTVIENADGTYTLQIGIKNTGDLTENFAVQGMLTDILGKEIKLEPQLLKVLPGQEGIASYVVNDIPWYGFTFDSEFTLLQKTDTTQYSGDKEMMAMLEKNEVLGKKEHSAAGSFFIFPWWIVIAVLIVLIVLLIVWGRRKKKAKRVEMQTTERMKQQ